MAIITISRGSYSRGKDVAEALAQKLGYECVSRDILLATCEEFSIPEIRLVKALHDAPSILDRFSHGKERYISYFRSAFLNHMAKDNIVYHGLSGHFFLQDTAHAFKVRIISDMENRIKEEMKRENCSAEEARYVLKKDDEERRKWGLQLYGKDTWDCSLYDMVLNIDTITVKDAVDILAAVIGKGRFNTTPESIRQLREKTLLAGIHAKIVNHAPKATVAIHDNIVTIGNLDGRLRSSDEQRQKTSAQLIKTHGLKEVIFTQPVKNKNSHINTFYNIID